jgi:hypothetical protein
MKDDPKVDEKEVEDPAKNPPEDPRYTALYDLAKAYNPDQIGDKHWETAWSIIRTDPPFNVDSDADRDYVRAEWPVIVHKIVTPPVSG